jgi:predicted RNase H-like nuclease (RuvC/YqgF family)
MDYITDSYWDYQNSTWNKQEDNRLLQRRIQQLHSQIGIHVDMLGMVSNASNGQLEKTKQLEKELEQKEEKMKGLELRMAEEELMVKTMNETVTTVETTRIAEKRAEVEVGLINY